MFASAAGTTRPSGAGLVALRGWYPIEILHFPVRSLAHCMRKYVTQFVALERNAEKGIPGHMADAYEAYRAGELEAFYAPLVVDDAALEQGVRTRRARDRHAPARSTGGARLRSVQPSPRPGELDELGAVASFAGETSALQEADLGLAYARARRSARTASRPSSAARGRTS